MDSARKIELQAPEDLAYLVANVRRAATARIDEAFPPVDDSAEDELRTRIEEHVNEVRYLNFFFFMLFFSCLVLFSFAHLLKSSFSKSTHLKSPTRLHCYSEKVLACATEWMMGVSGWMDGWMAEDLPLNI